MASAEEKIRQRIKIYEDFPKKGISFKDIFPLFQTPSLINDVIKLMEKHCKSLCTNIDAVIGIDSRGFLMGPMLAQQLGTSFVPIRKKGKLPGDTFSQSYDLEYGNDELQIQKYALKKGSKVVIVDDLMATGGTMEAACKLSEKAELEVLSSLCVVELTGLKGIEKLPKGTQFYSIVKYEY